MANWAIQLLESKCTSNSLLLFWYVTPNFLEYENMRWVILTDSTFKWSAAIPCGGSSLSVYVLAWKKVASCTFNVLNALSTMFGSCIISTAHAGLNSAVSCRANVTGICSTLNTVFGTSHLSQLHIYVDGP